MPTQAEIDAAARVMQHSVECGVSWNAAARDVLQAAEAVRVAAVDTMTEAELLAGLDLYINADGTCTCEVCRAYRAQQPLDQRMTQTHAPLAAVVRGTD